ncbi:uncharacterized protein LOC111867932 isoform X2 [Cryptotermes secundus]|uniref:uncharacterized protein LOC111867932 isoform X2 n=1 Tax=Cryptotermes secundus TaxID=105785 RepID=UPI000CD7C202|nr:uncharacterized protein LOC111867932 isoform X2 [Cryptotermes secundus]
MTTITVLLLLVAAASTIAFSPPERNGGPALVRRFAVDETAHPWFVVRRRRGIPAASKSASGAASFATSSSSSGSTSGSGSVPGYHSGFDGVQGHSGGNPSGFVFPGANDFANYGYGAYSPYGGAGYVPVDFNTLFQQYLNFMQRLAQQQAYATKGYGTFSNGPYYYAWTAGGTSSEPSTVVAASVASTPYYYKAAGYYYMPSASALNYNEPASSAPHYNKYAKTSQYYSAPNSAVKYYRTPTTTAQYYSTPTSSAQHFSTIFYSHASSGVPVRQHYSHSSAQTVFKPFNVSR